MIKFWNCHDCYYATKINTDTYQYRRKKYDEDADGERKDGEHDGET